jgi:hypothetical protein
MGEIDHFDKLMINSNKARGRRPFLLPKSMILLLLVAMSFLDGTTNATQLKSSTSASG